MVVGEIVHSSELLVIGGGPGGYVAALRAAQLGLDTTLVEEGELGGVCLQHGCIPSKTWIAAADEYDRGKSLAALGLPLQPGPLDLGALRAFKDKTVQQLTQGIAHLLGGRGVHVVQGRARFVSATAAAVEGAEGRQIHHFRNAVIATGSKALGLKSLPADGRRVLLPRHFLALAELPEHLAVVGGGYIGVELGMAAARLGAKVTLIEATDHLLGAIDPDLVRVVSRRMKELGIEVRLGASVESAVVQEDGVLLEVAQGADRLAIRPSHVLVAVGRAPNLLDLGLGEIGLSENGFLAVDPQLRTAVPGIYAVGDVTGPPMLAHRASAQGHLAAEAIAGHKVAFAPQAIPAVVYSDPEIAAVGLSEAEAAAQGTLVRTARFPLRALGRALAGRAPEGVAKLVVDQATGALLGAGIAGAHASDLIGEMALAIEMGATLEDVAATIHAHPTYAEAWHEAALLGMGQPLHILR